MSGQPNADPIRRLPAPAPRRRWGKKFLDALRHTGNHSAACRAAGVHRSTPYDAMQADSAFAAAYRDALDEACDGLELEARRRAHDGVDRPVIYQGRLCGTWVDEAGNVVAEGTPGARLLPLTVKEYSDTLLLALLKAHRPEKYRDNVKMEHAGSRPGGAIPHEVSAKQCHEHHIDLAAFAAFCSRMEAAGLGHVLSDGDRSPVEGTGPAPEAGPGPADGLNPYRTG
jgi:hypothetical protein